MDLMVFVMFGQFVAHVPRREDMDTGRDQGHHREHQHGQTVDVVVDGDHHAAKPGQLIKLPGVGRTQRVVGRKIFVDV